MKGRDGFVSNSSSCNFIVRVRNPEMSLEDRRRATQEAWLQGKYHDEDLMKEMQENGSWENMMEKHTSDGKYLILDMDVDWNAETEGLKMVKAVLAALNLDDVECVMEGY